MSSTSNAPTGNNRVRIVVATSVMLTFISYWRAAAVILNDLGSSAFYAGGIAEQAIGKSAPWFVLGVMLFAFAVRAVYVESCSMFVRGGVYRVVKEALGGTLAKLSVSALMFDYILTGPVSGVSAGQYIAGLINDTISIADAHGLVPSAVHHLFHGTPQVGVNATAVVFAIAVTLYFWWENIKGIEESSEKALWVMQITTVMVVMLLGWSLFTLLKVGGHLPPFPTLANIHYSDESLGFWKHSKLPHMFGILGLIIGFGHSVLAMSGEESLAQVYRELAHPKLKNLKRTAIVIGVYSFVFTGLVSLLAVMLIPDDVRVKVYSDNLIAGLAMHMVGPQVLRLAFRAFVVVVGFLILSGAVNTAIVGSNGVLNRVSEDGVLADWFRRPHKKYGTTYRIINLIVGLQLFTIIVSWGNIYTLGEAYAFGVVWSFVFKTISMLVLRYRYKGERNWKVPPNLHLFGVEIPIGLASVGMVLLSTAIVNLFTKSVATVSGLIFSVVFFAIFTFSEKVNRRKHAHTAAQMKEQFQLQQAESVERETVGIRPGNVLVPVRDYNTLNHLKMGAGAHRHPRTGRGRHDRPHQPVRSRRLRSFHRADVQRLRADPVHARRLRRRKFRQEDFAPGGAGSRLLVGHRPDRAQPRVLRRRHRPLQQNDDRRAGFRPGQRLGSHTGTQTAVCIADCSDRRHRRHLPHRPAHAHHEERGRRPAASLVAECHPGTGFGKRAPPRHSDRGPDPLRPRLWRARPRRHRQGIATPQRRWRCHSRSAASPIRSPPSSPDRSRPDRDDEPSNPKGDGSE